MPIVRPAVLTFTIGLLILGHRPVAAESGDTLPLRHRPSPNRIDVSMGQLGVLEVNRELT